jgi:hypothetical protein
MRVYVMSVFFVGSVAYLVAAPPTLVARDGTPYESDAVARVGWSPENEVARVRAHFDSVLAELDARDLSGLSADQRATRASLITTLVEYRDRGAFPQNYDFPDRLVPYFVDRKTGVRCAMAHLIESTSRADIVERVRSANNNVRVAQLAGDSAFTAWLDASGLTLAEAARIQPSYGGVVTVVEPDQKYRNASTIALPLSALSMAWNLFDNRNGEHAFPSVLGLTIGAATLGLGAFAETFPEPSSKLAVANGVVGAATVFISARGLVRRGRDKEPKSVPTAETSVRARSGVETSFAPAVSLVGQRSAGLTVNVRF